MAGAIATRGGGGGGKQATGVARLATGNSIRIETVSDLEGLANLMFRGGASAMPNVDRPEKVARIILAGAEIGLSPAQSLESLWMGKNGRIAIWGDGAIALVRASGLMEDFKEWVEGDGDDRMGVATAKRGDEVMVRKFSVRDANKAGLIERARGAKGDGPWVTYQDRMLTSRARGFLLRDLFPDVLRGLVTTEELQDYPDQQVTVIAVNGVPMNTPQLPAAGTTAVPTPSEVVPEPATTAAVVATKPAMVTDDQLKTIAALRASYVAGKGLVSADEQQAAWKELLGGYKVASAREFTTEQAAVFISTEGPKYDPFGFPATKASQS